LHKYFLIPVITFFVIICLITFYLQYINDDWKYVFLGTKIIIPDICNDESDTEIIFHSTDLINDRSFRDNTDSISDFQFHAIYLLPCEKEDRKFDVNKNIHYSLETINEWFLNKSNNQIINYDRINDEIIDTTFIRVNKTLKWFNHFKTSENYKQDASSRIEDIILSNSSLFHNFNKKKFIVFFDGWEKRELLFTEICGRSRFNGKISVFYTDTKWNMSRSCASDNLNISSNEEFGESEATILHEMLHTLAVPPRCAKNLDSESIFHVSDSADDIMNKVSGSLYLDFNNDDYYQHNIKDCQDLSNSNYLIYNNSN